MRSLIQFVLVIIVVIGVVGFWRHWFAVTTTQRPGDEKMDIHLQVDRARIKADTEQAKTAIRNGADRARSEWNQTASKVESDIENARDRAFDPAPGSFNPSPSFNTPNGNPGDAPMFEDTLDRAAPR